ncbi:MAG: hypothetical protein QOG09_218, partial [Solirubrobacterales bacterium]|nr:hypothetical protein [Solirubrobacterales bacterium]
GLLKSLLAECDGSAEDCVEHVTQALASEPVPDDIALLAFRTLAR